MIPSEVKKAMDVCIHAGITSECNGCVYREYEGGFCIDALMKDALALIEQQEKEIRRLKSGKEDNENECNT